MAEHTLLPWALDIEPHAAGYERWAAVIWAVDADGATRIIARIPEAAVHYDAAEVARVEANARLMSAAPDLLAALTGQRCFECRQWIEVTPGDRKPCDECADAIAAIAKATDKGGADVGAE